MRAHLTKSAIIAAICPALAACAGDRSDFPSLALRPFESGSVPEGTATPPALTRPVTDRNRLIDLRAAAANADSLFAVHAQAADALVRAAAGQPVTSAQHAAALVALAELDAQRGRTALALAALDSLAAEAATGLSPDPLLTTAQTEVAATLAREDAVIARLWGMLGS
jgi:hypothetical protein